ncbi:MAG: hypothetical protein Q9212_000666 [Teloschistes hypoglaucus]
MSTDPPSSPPTHASDIQDSQYGQSPQLEQHGVGAMTPTLPTDEHPSPQSSFPSTSEVMQTSSDVPSLEEIGQSRGVKEISSLLPNGTPTQIKAPVRGGTQKDRQQAIVWLAQDAVAAFMALAEGSLDMQCKIVRTWIDFCKTLEDTEGVNKIHELMVGELGEELVAFYNVGKDYEAVE